MFERQKNSVARQDASARHPETLTALSDNQLLGRFKGRSGRDTRIGFPGIGPPPWTDGDGGMPPGSSASA